MADVVFQRDDADVAICYGLGSWAGLPRALPWTRRQRGRRGAIGECLGEQYGQRGDDDREGDREGDIVDGAAGRAVAPVLG